MDYMLGHLKRMHIYGKPNRHLEIQPPAQEVKSTEEYLNLSGAVKMASLRSMWSHLACMYRFLRLAATPQQVGLFASKLKGTLGDLGTTPLDLSELNCEFWQGQAVLLTTGRKTAHLADQLFDPWGQILYNTRLWLLSRRKWEQKVKENPMILI